MLILSYEKWNIIMYKLKYENVDVVFYFSNKEHYDAAKHYVDGSNHISYYFGDLWNSADIIIVNKSNRIIKCSEHICLENIIDLAYTDLTLLDIVQKLIMEKLNV